MPEVLAPPREAAASVPAGAVPATRCAVAYLVNQYPKVSHSFIRREIEALERAGLPVRRLALRGWDAEVVDPADQRERGLTRYVLGGGAPGVLGALMGGLVSAALRSPRRFWDAARTAWRLGGTGAARPRWMQAIYLAEACVVARWLREERVDHLHAHFGTNAAAVALLAHRLCRVRYSFTVHGPEEFDQPQALRLADKVSDAAFTVAISSFGRSQLFRWVEPVHWPRIKVVHCGLDESHFAAPMTPPPQAPRLVCVGRLCEQKGQLLLLQALRAVVDSGRAVHLTLAGDGEMRPMLEAEIARLRLHEHVRITGWLSGAEVNRELLAARALVLPSFAEGLPVVIMEAMALGRPVLSTTVAGIPELVLDGVTGWLVPAGDVDRLARALERCLATPVPELATMGSAARERCRARHAIDAQAAKLAALIRTAGAA